MLADSPADLVVRGGRIRTVDRSNPQAEALAVRDGAVIALGREADLRPLVGPRTRVIELAGGTAVPGFVDAHVHPIHGGLARLRCELHDLRGRSEYLAAVERYAAEHPEQAWIRGGGWSMADFPGGMPHRTDLDRISPDRPVFLSSRDGHTAWVNSRALALAGLEAGTPDPEDGRIERDPDGSPTGCLQEGAIELVRRQMPPNTAVEVEEGLVEGQRHLHSLGITGWQDAIILDEDLDAYLALAGRGQLSGRVVGALWWDRERGLDQVPELVDQRERGRLGRFAATSVKIMQDGVLENFTGAMIDPYLGADARPSGNRGISMVDPEVLGPAVTALEAEGFQVHVHAIGDRAVREALDAFETARAARPPGGSADFRHHIAHIQVIHPDDIGRFPALDVVPNAQPYWAVFEDQMEELTIPFLGPERTGWQYPFGSLHRAGARLAMGSDWSVSTADPLAEIEAAVERIAPYHRGEKPPFLPDERLPPEVALEAFTLGSAFVNHLDAETGSLAVGKRADLAILDRDPFAPDAGPIGDARVLGTFVDGVPVFEDPALGG